MMTCYSLLRAAGLLLVAAGLITAPPPAIKGWGQADDPDGDCRFEARDSKLTIRVPGTPHNLVADGGQLNAPRVLSSARGEFIVMVRAAGDVHPGPEPSVPDSLPYNGTGLLLWVDRDNYIRLERAGLIQQGAYISYANFEHFSGGRRTFSQGLEIQNLPTTLRLERRGGTVYASVSQDGATWNSFRTLEVTLPEEMKLGVAAVNTSTKPFAGELEGLTVFTRHEVGAP
jgi:regulation of enolase protein 1 (concanavalin A-like superfamily)